MKIESIYTLIISAGRQMDVVRRSQVGLSPSWSWHGQLRLTESHGLSMWWALVLAENETLIFNFSVTVPRQKISKTACRNGNRCPRNSLFPLGMAVEARAFALSYSPGLYSSAFRTQHYKITA